MAQLPPGFFTRVADFRRFVTVGMQGGLGVIQELDLTLAQAIAIFQLGEQGPMGLSGLVAAVGRSQAATSHLVEQLEQRGLVKRRADASDGRRRLVELTAKGKSAVQKIEAVRRVALERALDPVPAEVLRRFDAALAEVLDALRA